VAAGRAQESRQDVSLSGTALIEPFVESSNTVRVAASPAFGVLASYRFMLTPSSAIEGNYGITYQNSIHYRPNTTNNYNIKTRTQEASFAYVRSFNYRKFNPFVEAGGGALIFMPILDIGTTTLDTKQEISMGGFVRRRNCIRDQPQFRHPRRIPRFSHQSAGFRPQQL